MDKTDHEYRDNALQRAADEFHERAAGPGAVAALPDTLADLEQTLERLAAGAVKAAHAVTDWERESGGDAHSSDAQALRWQLFHLAARLRGALDASPEARRRAGALLEPATAGTLVAGASDERRPVICAVDDNGLAPAVLATGARLARRLDVSLTVVHSPHPDVLLTGERYRLALERGNEFVNRLTEGYDVDERVVEADEPGHLITALAREGASLVVLGTRGRTGLRAAVLGSVSHAVIADAPCPVVTVSGAASGAVGAVLSNALATQAA